MKVALMCKKFTPDLGGLEKYATFLAGELVRLGHEVHVFANQWKEEPGVSMHRVPVVSLSSPLKNLSYAYFASRAVRDMGFDVVHSMERTLSQDIFRVSDGINPVQLRQRYPNRGVRWFKSRGPRRLALGFLEKRIFLKGGCRVVMANSKLVKNQIIEHYGILPEKVVVIYNGVDGSRFHPGVKQKYRGPVRRSHGLSDGDLVLLFVSNDFKLKGLRLLLEAVALIPATDVKLLVIGGDEAGAYMKLAAQKGLGGRVLFLGRKSDLERYYGASDVFVLPTRYDAFANVCLEAMAAGLPVITSADNGAAELIQEGSTGYVVCGRDPRVLAQRIADLESPEARRKMGEKAAMQAGTYSPERHMTEVLALYRRVARLRGR